MNPFIENFRDCAHQAGEYLNIRTSVILRDFQLMDFLENALQDGDDAPTIVVKALSYFCAEEGPTMKVFQWMVFTVGLFLKDCQGKGRSVPEQAIRDLLKILASNANEAQIRRWIVSHFGHV